MKKIIFILILTMLSLNVIGDHQIDYPYYMGVNESELIKVTHPADRDEEINIFLKGILYSFNEQADNVTHTLYITNEEEEDIPYVINTFLKGVNQKNITNGDGTQENQLIIDDSRLYGIRWEHLIVNHTNGTVENDQLCPYIGLLTGNPIIRTWIYVQRDDGTRNYNFGDTVEITNTEYDYICSNAQLIFDQNYTSPFYKYFGFECTNCDSSNKFKIGLDTSGNITNNSTIQDNITSNITYQDYNFMGKAFLVESTEFEVYTGTFKFRIPFYLNISIVDDYNSSFNPIFNYIYLKNSSVEDSNKYADLGSSISKVLTLGLYNKQTWDYDLTHWTELNANSKGQIKLYEKGNYSINLLSLKTFKTGGWIYEFYKPQYTKKQIDTTLDTNLQITEEVNQSITIQGSEYELNKSMVIFNWVKWFIFIIIAIIGITACFYTPNPMTAIAVLLSVILPIIYKLLF